MNADFHDIAGLITDGSGPLDRAGLEKLVAAGWDESTLARCGSDEFAIAGAMADAPAESDAGVNGATASFFLARGAASGPFDQWRGTKTISQFGEGGTGAWAAARAFPEHQRIWLARDQFGQQPLYYAEKGGATAFSTDLHWFHESGFVPRAFNREGFSELVQLQFMSGSPTAYQGIRRVFPGETLVIERGRIVDRLRRPTVPLSDRAVFDRAAAVDALDDLLDASVRQALDGARMIGCVITGNLAATVLAVAIARRAKRRVRAYVPVLADANAAKPAIEVGSALARSLGFEVVPLAVDREALFDCLPGIIGGMPDPVADHAALLWDSVAKAAREDGATLVLPSGGQELFGAYGRYRTAARPLWMGGRAMRGRGHLQGLGGLPEGPSHWRDGLTGVENRLRGSNYTRIQTLQLTDISTWLPNDTLLGEHELIARAGVETRRPYLSPELAGFAFSLSDRLKLKGRSGGVLMRYWLAKTFPSAEGVLAADRPGAPLAEWIGERAGDLGPLVDRVVADAGQMPEGAAGEVFTQLAAKKTKRLGMAAWQLLYFALWYRIHIEGATPEDGIEAALNQST